VSVAIERLNEDSYLSIFFSGLVLDLESDRLAHQHLHENLPWGAWTPPGCYNWIRVGHPPPAMRHYWSADAATDQILVIMYLPGLDIVDGIRRLDLEGDGLAREGLVREEWSSLEGPLKKLFQEIRDVN